MDDEPNAFHAFRGTLLVSIATILLGVATWTALSSGSPDNANAILKGDEHECPLAKKATQSIEAAFRRESYAPGSTASLVVYESAGQLTLQVFRVGPERTSTIGNITMNGVPVSPKRAVGPIFSSL